MTMLPPDPLEPAGIAGFAERLRSGGITAQAATLAYLERIEVLDPRLGAYQYVAADQALEAAGALDGLLAAGTDLGPLMGVPVVLKDLIAAEGMPTTGGSNLDLSDLIGPEGSFVRSLKRAGCVVIGKSKTVEMARGASGINSVRGTPWNPWDAGTHRAPGGSSSGSAVAMAAGLCGFAIGTDTGGSVRGPAAFCGVFGLKTTKGLWALDGIYPNSPTFDTIGPITRSAADAAAVFGALSGGTVPRACRLRGLRLGRPVNHFFDGLDPEVESCTEAALGILAEAGVDIVPMEIPEVAERESFLHGICTVEFIACLGRQRLLESRDLLEPLTFARALPGLEVTADTHARLLARHRELCRIIAERMADIDGWVCPTTGLVAPTIADITDIEKGLKLEARLGLNTHPVSFFGLTATTTPIQGLGSDLPVGLQIVCRGGADAKALSIALALEDLLGVPAKPDLGGFAAGS